MSIHGTLAWLPLCGAVLLACGCSESTAVAPRPTVIGASAQANPLNALAIAVTFEAAHADSAHVACSAENGEPPVATPPSAVAGGRSEIDVLGLLPSTLYSCSVVASGRSGSASDLVSYKTPDLPTALAGVRLAITGAPPPGFIVTEVARDGNVFTVAFDSLGRVRWYRGFAAQPGELAMETEQLPSGDFTVYVGASTGAQPVDGHYFEFRPNGEIVRQYEVGAPYYTDSHELLLSFASGAMTAAQLYGYDLRPMDLSALGGRPDQPVAGHTLVRQSATGSVEFLWNSWDHFSLADWLFVPPNLASLASIDFDHPNSLAFDRDGNYIVSFAGLGEITCIDAVTGEMRWRLGGKHNEFAIVGDPLGGFGFQHDVRVLENGDLLFFDNGLAHSPPQSRAVEYRLDVKNMAATLVWEYRHDPPVFNPFVGSVQRFHNGNTLVGYGALDLMTESAASGARVWEGRLTINGGSVPFFYRARRIGSLYRYQAL